MNVSGKPGFQLKSDTIRGILRLFSPIYGPEGPRVVSTTLTRFWRKLASYQPKKHFDDKTAVFLATPKSFKVVRCVFPALLGQKCAENTRFPLASKCVL